MCTHWKVLQRTGPISVYSCKLRISLQSRPVWEHKIQLFGERSVQAAISFNELADFYLRSNDLEAAQRALKKALKVRDYRSAGGLEMGPRWHRDSGTCIGVALLLSYVADLLISTGCQVWLNTVTELLQLHAKYVCSEQILCCCESGVLCTKRHRGISLAQESLENEARTEGKWHVETR